MTLKKHFVFVASILVLANVLSTIVTYTYAGGDKGWWPLYLVVSVALSLTYALIFSLFASRYNFERFPSGYVHFSVAVGSVLKVALFYGIDVDWQAVNSGVEMSLFAKLVHSDFVHYGWYAVGLVSSIVVGLVSTRTQ